MCQQPVQHQTQNGHSVNAFNDWYCINDCILLFLVLCLISKYWYWFPEKISSKFLHSSSHSSVTEEYCSKAARKIHHVTTQSMYVSIQKNVYINCYFSNVQTFPQSSWYQWLTKVKNIFKIMFIYSVIYLSSLLLNITLIYFLCFMNIKHI